MKQQNQSSHAKLTKEEIDKRLEMNKATLELGKIKKEMQSKYARQDLSDNIKSTPADTPLQNLNTAGLDLEEIYKNATQALEKVLNATADYAFSEKQHDIYFPNDRITGLVMILKRAKLDMLAFSVMDIFKSRVKQLNNNSLPLIVEKTGMFNKPIRRHMKPEEIAKKFQIENDLPSGETSSLTTVGTKKGITKYLQEQLLQNDDVKDPIKKGPRKQVVMFLQAAGLVNLKTTDNGEKQFLACFLTPEKLMPRNRQDADGLQRLTSLFVRGAKWIEKKTKENPPHKQANNIVENKQ